MSPASNETSVREKTKYHVEAPWNPLRKDRYVTDQQAVVVGVVAFLKNKGLQGDGVVFRAIGNTKQVTRDKNACRKRYACIMFTENCSQC